MARFLTCPGRRRQFKMSDGVIDLPLDGARFGAHDGGVIAMSEPKEELQIIGGLLALLLLLLAWLIGKSDE